MQGSETPNDTIEAPAMQLPLHLLDPDTIRQLNDRTRDSSPARMIDPGAMLVPGRPAPMYDPSLQPQPDPPMSTGTYVAVGVGAVAVVGIAAFFIFRKPKSKKRRRR